MASAVMPRPEQSRGPNGRPDLRGAEGGQASCYSGRSGAVPGSTWRRDLTEPPIPSYLSASQKESWGSVILAIHRLPLCGSATSA